MKLQKYYMPIIKKKSLYMYIKNVNIQIDIVI